MNDILKVKIELLKDVPGVYLMKDKDGNVIYVGKAKSLIRRVKSYFFRPQEGKVFRMVREICDFDTIQINSEKEALLLELNLIRKYYPKYNVLLKDGKTYPFICLSKENEPRLKMVYKPSDKKNYYFGPYTSSSYAWKIIDLLNKIFPLRKCNVMPSSPCLYYHIGQCLGPCIHKDLNDKYVDMIKEIKRFLNGDDSKIKQDLVLKMKEASNSLNFEKAKEYKDLIDAINHIQEKQNISLSTLKDADVIASSSREGYFSFAVMTYRKGLLIGKNIYVLEKEGEDNIEQLTTLIYQYYLKHDLPKEIIVGSDELKNSLINLLDVRVNNPSRGEKKNLLLIALENAKNGIDEHFLSARLEDDNLLLLERLGGLLNIKTPLHIELFDNSHLQGSEAIGAMVVFINGVKVPSMYRKYNIQASSGKDDLKSMYEVIYRRYSRLINEEQKLPDLIIVDGGYNQLEVAKKALSDLNISIPLCGLSKDEHHNTSMLIDENEVYPLDTKDKLFLFLVRMQDEVHRYAISFHRQKRSKKLGLSFFDNIEGIGMKRKELLTKAYPSLASLKSATLEELTQLIPIEVAKRIIEKINDN